MSDYRVYIRSGSFNGVTDDSAVYLGNRFVFTTATAGAVGRFTPASLGRVNVASACRVQLSGSIGGGDYVRVLDALGGTRFNVPASKASSGWFFLGPTDVLAISSTASQAVIVVNDLDDGQLGQFALGEQAEGSAGLQLDAPAPVISAAASVVVPAFQRGTFYITSTHGGATTIDPASVSTFGVGARIVVYNTDATNRLFTPVLGELVNGAANRSVTQNSVLSFEAAGSQWLCLT